MVEAETKQLSTEPVLPAQVEVLRKLWIDAIDNARRGTQKARADAENLTPDHPRRHDLMAYIDAIKLEVELRRVAYEDAWRRFEAQEGRAHDQAADRLAAANTKLARSQTFIAAAVAAFTFLQLLLALAQAMKWVP